eukprot:SAG11_NODE_1867_length_4152_cov_3.687886_3_plen_102_part_00
MGGWRQGGGGDSYAAGLHRWQQLKPQEDSVDEADGPGPAVRHLVGIHRHQPPHVWQAVTRLARAQLQLQHKRLVKLLKIVTPYRFEVTYRPVATIRHLEST